MNKELQLDATILRLKGYLNRVGHVSYAFSHISRTPLSTMTTEQKEALIKEYAKLLHDVVLLMEEIKNNDK